MCLDLDVEVIFKLNSICVNIYADVNINWGSAGGVKRPSKGT